MVDGWSPERIATRPRRRRRRAGPGLDTRSVIEAGRPGDGPSVCRCERCGGRHRHPTRHTHAAGAIAVAMRCPDCGAEDTEELGPDELAALERADEDAEVALAVALAAVAERRRREDLDLLIACLRDDLILPEDF